MSTQRFKNFSFRTAEVIIALALVLAAFAIIMVMVNSMFPSGSGLVGMSDQQGQLAGTARHDLLISAGDYEAGLMDMAGLAAVLDHTNKTVKRKPSDGIAWNSVTGGTPLFDRDAVQTFKGSSAEIIFDKSNRLTMSENSLIIIQRMEKDVYRNERRSQVVVVDGELRGTVSGDGKQGLRVEVTTPNAVARVKGGDETAEFSVKVNPDKSSTVTVFSGQAELVSMGESIIIEANHSATAEQGAEPLQVVPLPKMVRLIRPFHRTGFYYRDLPPRVKFEWEAMANGPDYRIQVALDEEFKQLIVDELVEEAVFSHGNLRRGQYFWRVKAIRNWVEGEYTKARLLNIEQDRDPPSLEVTFPPRFSEQPSITLIGSSEVSAQVLVDGHEVALNEDGSFSYDIELLQGVNVLVVEALDEVGNVTYKSGMVYGKF